MRQLVLVDHQTTLTPEALLAAVFEAEPFPTPIVVFQPPAAAPTDVSSIERRPRSWTAEIEAEDFLVGPQRRLTLLVDQRDGHFARTVGERTRALVYGCDTVVAICPSWAFLEAVKLFERALFAIGGEAEPAAVRTSVSLLMRTVDHLRGSADSRRLAGWSAGRAEALEPDDPSGAALAALGDRPVFGASGRGFADEAEAIGFAFNGEKVRLEAGALTVQAGADGIVVFGPYVPLEAGAYRFVVSVAVNGSAAPQLRLEAVANAGATVFASQDVTSADADDDGHLNLEFEVPPDADLLPVELRVWALGGGPAFRLKSLSLAGR